jgi:hypothetical protein
LWQRQAAIAAAAADAFELNLQLRLLIPHQQMLTRLLAQANATKRAGFQSCCRCLRCCHRMQSGLLQEERRGKVQQLLPRAWS